MQCIRLPANISPSRPDSGPREKINVIFYFHTLFSGAILTFILVKCMGRQILKECSDETLSIF